MKIRFIQKKSFRLTLLSLMLLLVFSMLIIYFHKQNTSVVNNQPVLQLLKNEDILLIKKFLLQKINSPYININHKVKAGDNIKKVLEKYEIDKKDIISVINLLKKTKYSNKIYAGNYLKIVSKKNSLNNKNSLISINIPLASTINIKILRNEEQQLVAEKIVTKLYKKLVYKENIIKNNLYSSAIEAKIEPNIIIEFARIYGFEIDFQRDIRKNDVFKILYEIFSDENGKFVKNGSIIYAYMSINEKELSLYKFGDDRNYGYFDINGKSVEKALMKTPINGARLSSSFGMRKHPILGYSKKHTGTDFAAKEGTPIMASGSGTIVRASWCGGGGNCIKIKHNSTYQTVYAHMKNFRKGIRIGKKVRQGEIIGYVGSTGMSTGPHLHYEVIINGKKVNSQKLNLPSGKVLKDKERQLFEIHRIKTDVLISETIEH